MKTFIITGTSSGIGLELVKILIQKGLMLFHFQEIIYLIQ